jgi:hydroxypyruvate isomerase
MPPRSPSRRRFLAHSARIAAAPLLAAPLLAPRAAAAAPAAASQDQELGSIGRTPHTKFAINVEMWMHGKSYPEKLRRVREMGFPAVEFWPWRGKDLDEWKKLKDETGLVYTQFTGWGFEPGMNDPKNHPQVLAEIEASCKAANVLDVKLLCVVGGNDQPGMTQEQMHENIVTCLKQAAPIAERHQVTLMLESMNIRVDHKGHCLYGSPPALRIARAVNSPWVKLMWDIYHMHISEGDNCGHIREGFDQIAYFQLADHPGRNEPGTGEVHYNRILKQIHDLGFRGYVGAECVPLTDEVTAARRLAAADVW